MNDLTAAQSDLAGADWAFAPRRHVPAWVLSCLLHTLILFALAVAFRWAPRGASQQADRSGGIVLVQSTSPATEYLSEGDFSDAAAAALSQRQPPPLPRADERPPDLPGIAATPSSELAAAGDDPAARLPGANELISPQTSNRQVGGRVTTDVFGVEGTGSRFVYVFDRSASMSDQDSKPLRAAKQQLLKSLNSLPDTSQFQIIFYNHQSMLFNPDGGATRLFFANPDNRRLAEDFVQSIRPDGGTDHVAALKLAFAVRPDVIFFLTDAEGGLSPAELSELADRNRSGAVINLIEFGIGSRRMDDRSLEQLAIESGGQYLYKNILTLAD